LDSPQTPQGALDAATVLPFVAAMLLAPPIILIFAVPVMLAGIPLILIYVFGVWAVIILSAALLARRLSKAEGIFSEDKPPEAGGQS
jgi:hypothetical protein